MSVVQGYERGGRAVPLATLRQVLDEAAKGGYGVGAFNEEIHSKPPETHMVMHGSVAQRIMDFGSGGHAGDYEVLSLDEMAKRYAGSPVGA
jgi:hypothetical protein